MHRWRGWVILVVVGCDQALKWWATSFGGGLVYNRGVAFGWGQELWGGWWGEWLIIGVLLWIWWYGRVGIGWYLILGGGISNFLDRLVRGGVVDYLQLFSWFPRFNLADVIIVVGVGWLFLVQLGDGETAITAPDE